MTSPHPWPSPIQPTTSLSESLRSLSSNDIDKWPRSSKLILPVHKAYCFILDEKIKYNSEYAQCSKCKQIIAIETRIKKDSGNCCYCHQEWSDRRIFVHETNNKLFQTRKYN